MKTPALLFALLALTLGLSAPLPAPAAEEKADSTQRPTGPLTETEKQFVGKWRGERATYRWEIERKSDRTFEIAFMEPDPDKLIGSLKNYAIGHWWVDGDRYRFEWTRWWGDEGEFSGVLTEKVEKVEADRIVTLTEDDQEAPENVETRVEEFRLSAWKLKPAKFSPKP